MIDIHSHILPGLDDGSQSMEETLAMARQLQEVGFTKLIATPHVMESRDLLRPDEIIAAVENVQMALAEAEIALEIHPGAENYIFPDLAKWVREEKLMTLGNRGKYILIELPMLEIPQYTDQVVFDLQVAGLTPVLAHPERNRGIVENPERLLDWAKKGVLFQLDLRSLGGKYGPEANELALRMLQSNLVHLIGSDAHRVARSSSSYLEALESVKGIVGGERFEEITLRNPQAIIDGKALTIEDDREYVLKESAKTRKKRGFWRWFG